MSSYIQKQGYEVRFVEHKLKRASSVYGKQNLVENLKTKIVNFLVKKEERKRENAFSLFVEQNFPEEKYSHNFDKIIVGSDQVWNLNLTHDDLYYLGEDFDCEISSYAASCGKYSAMSEVQRQLLVRW